MGMSSSAMSNFFPFFLYGACLALGPVVSSHLFESRWRPLRHEDESVAVFRSRDVVELNLGRAWDNARMTSGIFTSAHCQLNVLVGLVRVCNFAKVMKTAIS